MAAFTKKAILESFEKLVLTKPFDKITVKEIIDDCEIARNTFYYHFCDIYDVLEAWLEQKEQIFLKKMLAEPLEDSLNREILKYFGAFMGKNSSLYQVYKNVQLPEVKQYFRKSVENICRSMIDHIYGHIPASEEDKVMICNFYSYALEGVLTNWMDSGMNPPLDQLVNRIEALIGEDPIAMSLMRSAELNHNK